MESIIYKEESFDIVGICYEVYNYLGHGFLEIVYKDAIEYELQKSGLAYTREKDYLINYKGAVLPHKFYADFVILDKIILEVKSSKEGISDVFIAQALNYLKVSGAKLVLIVNFGKEQVEFRRVVRT